MSTIMYYRARFTGQAVARCTTCHRVWGYWADEDDLAHQCPGHNLLETEQEETM